MESCNIFTHDHRSRWILSHTFLPFLITLFGLKPEYTMLAVYIFESFEGVYYQCVNPTDGTKETLVDAVFEDPVSGFLGIIVAYYIIGSFKQVAWWWLLLLCIPTIMCVPQIIYDDNVARILCGVCSIVMCVVCYGCNFGFKHNLCTKCLKPTMYIFILTALITAIPWNSFYVSCIAHILLFGIFKNEP